MSLTQQAFSGVLWTAGERFGVQLIQFVVVVVLARLLTPEDFGLVAMLMVIFAISSVLVNGGFTAALIREPEITEEDKCTAFWLNLGAAIVLYVVIWVAAPTVAAFFGQPELVDLTRFMGLHLFFLSLTLVQQAELSHGLLFKRLGLVSLAAATGSGVVAVGLALAGTGVWALAANFVLLSAFTSLLLWIVNPWLPRRWVSSGSFRKLFGFGWKLAASGLLDQTYQNIYKVVIGKFFAAATLGFYTQAQSFQRMPSQSLVGMLQKVTYPLLARVNDDPVRLKRGYRKIIQASSYIIFPAMVGMALTAEPLVLTLVGARWLETVPFLQILCVSGALYHLHSININILKVVGRSDLILRLEVIKKANITVAIIVGIQFGIWGLLIGQVVSSYIALFINMYYTRSLIDFSTRSQLADIFSVLWQSVPMALVVVAVLSMVSGPPALRLASAVAAGLVSYLATGILTRPRTLADITAMAAGRFPALARLAVFTARG